MSSVVQLQEYVWEIYHILRKNEDIRKDSPVFKQSCCALDAIGDTGLALQDYLSCEESFNIGITYVLAYGVLQAVFLQQDAMKHLANSLDFPFQLPEELREIRELRNDAIGHPTQRQLDKKTGYRSFHHIARISLTKRGFQLLSTYSDKESIDIKDVDLYGIIDTQTTFAIQFVVEILDYLKRTAS